MTPLLWRTARDVQLGGKQEHTLARCLPEEEPYFAFRHVTTTTSTIRLPTCMRSNSVGHAYLSARLFDATDRLTSAIPRYRPTARGDALPLHCHQMANNEHDVSMSYRLTANEPYSAIPGHQRDGKRDHHLTDTARRRHVVGNTKCQDASPQWHIIITWSKLGILMSQYVQLHDETRHIMHSLVTESR
jgi:hypothetical protein